MDYLFAKSWGPQSYFRYTILNTKWTFCASMRTKLRCVFYLFVFLLENTSFVCISMGNGPVGGTITTILKHQKVYHSKTHLNFFLIFAENVTLLFLNIIKLIPLGASTSKYKKSTFSIWLYKGVQYADGPLLSLCLYHWCHILYILSYVKKWW